MQDMFFFDSSAELDQNEYGDLAIRFATNEVYIGVGNKPGKGFVSEAIAHLDCGKHPQDWQRQSERKLRLDGHGWHLISSMGYIDDDKSKPAVGLDVKPENLGNQARKYLHQDMPDRVPLQA